MFFVLSKIVGFVADPLVFISSFFLIGLFMRKKYKRRSFLLIAFTLLIFFSNGFIYQIFFEKWEVKAAKLLESYDYGILLGGMISLNSTENEIKFGRHKIMIFITCVTLIILSQILSQYSGQINIRNIIISFLPFVITIFSYLTIQYRLNKNF